MISKLKTYFGILFFFILDICIYNLFSQYVVNFLLCYIIVKNLTHEINLTQNIFAIFFLLLGSFLHYGIYGLDIGLFFILIIIINKTKKIVTNIHLLLFLIICFYFFFKFLILEYIILKQTLKLKLMFLSLVLNFIISVFFLLQTNRKNNI